MTPPFAASTIRSRQVTKWSRGAWDEQADLLRDAPLGPTVARRLADLGSGASAGRRRRRTGSSSGATGTIRSATVGGESRICGSSQYHAVTVLMPDGRVLTTAGTDIKFKNTPRSTDIEAWSPPYLFRVSTTWSTATPQRGATLAFNVSHATRLNSVVLMGTTTQTHWVEAGVPRPLDLAVPHSRARAQVTLPSDANVLPVGRYLLFGMVDDIRSVARIVRVRS